MLAAVLIIAIYRIGEINAVKYLEALGVASANTEDHEILALLSGVYYLDLLTVDLEINEIFGLREEEILCRTLGVTSVRKLNTISPLGITGSALTVVCRDIKLFVLCDLGKERIDLGKIQLIHQLFPLS